ncbi:pentatricopeptide repeat-containing protein At5g66520 [Dendrobium catenatum]|nr:pentatricopeptide repeat-containing protein At5g66520 [Dendrobium catenatum]
MRAPSSTITAHTNSTCRIASSRIHRSSTYLSSLPSTKLLKQTHATLLRSGEIHDAIIAGKLISNIANSHPSNLPYALTFLSHATNIPINAFAWNSLIRGFAHSPSPENSISLYRRMLADGFFPNNYTYPFLLKASSYLEDRRIGLSLHATIIRRGLDGMDPFIQTSLINFHAVLVSVETARQLFDESLVRDVTSWNALIKGYVACGQHMNAIYMFQAMQDCGPFCADEITMLSVVSACAHLGALEMGRWVHSYIERNRFVLNLNLGTALINMYAKCGEIDSAKVLFWEMQEKDVRTWSVMINGLAIHGHAKEALVLFEEMQRFGVFPDSVTITALLIACSHGGMVEQGRTIFSRMRMDYDIEPTIEHYGCIVGLLGRAGKLDEALALIRRSSLKPDIVLWGSLLVDCMVHKNIGMGEIVVKEILKLDPNNAGAHVFLSNMYATSGKWDVVQEVRNFMKEQMIHKPPGSSLIEVNGVVHEFLSGDSSHPQFDGIYKMLDEICRLVSLKGHKPLVGGVSFDINDEDREVCLSQHSEKLAVAFGLISTNPGSVIRIIKNLRICRDCHAVMKLVSEAFGRIIIVRDCNRFHHFSKGSCSCRDYW